MGNCLFLQRTSTKIPSQTTPTLTVGSKHVYPVPASIYDEKDGDENKTLLGLLDNKLETERGLDHEPNKNNNNNNGLAFHLFRPDITHCAGQGKDGSWNDQWKQIEMNTAYLNVLSSEQKERLTDMASIQMAILSTAPLVSFQGGFNELQTDMWSACPNLMRCGKNAWLGLGRSFFLPVTTLSTSLPMPKVFSPASGRVIHVMKDQASVGGWAGRVLLFLEDHQMYVMIARLDPKSPMPKLHQDIRKGDLLGLVAPAERNGGWAPHVYVQVMTSDYLEAFRSSDLDEIPAFSDTHFLPMGLHDPLNLAWDALR